MIEYSEFDKRVIEYGNDETSLLEAFNSEVLDFDEQIYFQCSKANLRNCKIKIFHYLKDNDLLDDIATVEFSEKEIYEKLNCKRSDLFFFKDQLFDVDSTDDNSRYKINQDIQNEISNYNQNPVEINLPEKREEFLNEFASLDTPYNSDKIKSLGTLASEIHWYILPIFPEYLLLRNESVVIPEDTPETFYSDYRAIRELSKILSVKDYKWEQENGDDNLDKELSFKVYTNRWRSYNTFKETRTIYGWNVTHLAINGFSMKNGKGSLIKNLEQDIIFYPEYAVQEALEILWERADKTSGFLSNLQEQIQEIADWITETEKAKQEKKPSWY